MLDQKIISRFEDLIDVKVNERRSQLDLEISKINAEASKNGSFQSSRRYLLTHQAYERELAIRAILAWESLVRVHRTLGCKLTDTLREDLKAAMLNCLNKNYEELKSSFDKALKSTPVESKLTLANAFAAAVKKHEVEADLYVDSLFQAETRAEKHPMTQEYHFYGSVGAVQTGANAVANVVQNLGTEDKASLSKALNEVEEALRQASSLPENQKQDLISITKDCSTEITSSSPNNTRLLTLLNVLGTSIQSIASAQPAYQALAAAVLPLGITLP